MICYNKPHGICPRTNSVSREERVLKSFHGEAEGTTLPKKTA